MDQVEESLPNPPPLDRRVHRRSGLRRWRPGCTAAVEQGREREVIFRIGLVPDLRSALGNVGSFESMLEIVQELSARRVAAARLLEHAWADRTQWCGVEHEPDLSPEERREALREKLRTASACPYLPQTFPMDFL